MSKNNHVLSDTQIKAFMQRALDLAQLGAGNVSPNPMVGCVIVHQGKIIGEGWHQRYGHWHAEVNAVADVKTKTFCPNPMCL
jgi:diaminohydroxyphosphoribosylaminopyrimidine deaminase/5-amino-6-(5-phosphoribosylamino)uracil reductase